MIPFAFQLTTSLCDELQACLGTAYSVDREAGRGGMAAVFEANDLKHHRKVAIKVLNRELLATARERERFLKEIRVTAALHHPHILPLHDSGVCGESPYYVMPFVDDGSLRDRLLRERKLPLRDALRITAEVCSALDHAHRKGIVHRDIKPANILLQDGAALVSDFGIAHAVEQLSDDETTLQGVSPGTPQYMSPEQVTGESKTDGRSDIFALGCVLYEMLAGERPFGGSKQVTMDLRVFGKAPDIARVRPDVPKSVCDAIARALARNPSNRFDNAADFARALELPPAGRVAPLNSMGSLVRNRFFIVGVVALAVAVGSWSYFSRRSVPSELSTAIAVFPFEVYGKGDIQYLGEGIPELLSTSLNGAGDLRTVDSRAMFSVLAESGVRHLDERTARQLSSRLGASAFVLGTVAASGNRLRIRAKAFQLDSTASTADIIIDGTESDLFALLDSLTLRLISTWSRAPAQHLVQLASATTRSLPALKGYLVGASALRRQSFDSAVTVFREVTEIDTTFALAYYGLSLAAEYATRAELAQRAALQAARFADRLPARDRDLIAAFATSRRGDFLTAERLFSDIVDDTPDNVDAWFELGEIRFHAGPRIGLPIARSRSAFERVLLYEPRSTLARFHLARLAASEGDTRALDSIVSKIVSLTPGGNGNVSMRALRAFANGDSAEIRAIRFHLTRPDNDMDVFLTTSQLATYLHDLKAASQTARDGTVPVNGPPQRALSYAMLAHLEVARGRWTAAMNAIDSMGRFYPLQALEQRALLSTMPNVQVPVAELRHLRDSLEKTRAPAMNLPDDISSFYTADLPVQPLIRLYLLGMLTARMGDVQAAMRIADEIERVSVDENARELSRDFAHFIRSTAEKDPALSLGHLEQMRLRSWYLLSTYSPFWSLADARFARAQLLTSFGRDRESLAWLNSFGDFSLYDARFQAPSHLEQARIWNRRGRRDLAALHYRKFLELWSDADPQFQPVVARARQELAEISRLN